MYSVVPEINLLFRVFRVFRGCNLSFFDCGERPLLHSYELVLAMYLSRPGGPSYILMNWFWPCIYRGREAPPTLFVHSVFRLFIMKKGQNRPALLRKRALMNRLIHGIPYGRSHRLLIIDRTRCRQ